MARFDLTTRPGRFKARWAYFWADHGFIRLGFTNAHWLDADMIRSNQPSPGQLAWWKRKGVRTVVNLRGPRDQSYYWLEKDACARLGLTMIDAALDSRDAPPADRIRRARDLFKTMAYPVLIHCKSGADRAGLMAVFYRHFHLGEPISTARAELGRRTLHNREGATGVLDHVLDVYVRDIEPTGVSFIDWVDSPAYDPDTLKASFRATRWGTFVNETLLRRE